LFESFAGWMDLVDQAIGGHQGWDQVERMLRAAFQFFEDRPDFVSLVRWEALEGGPFLRDELNVMLKPMFFALVLRRRSRARTTSPLRRAPTAPHRLRRGLVVPL
jgi:hypothetical protein